MPEHQEGEGKDSLRYFMSIHLLKVLGFIVFVFVFVFCGGGTWGSFLFGYLFEKTILTLFPRLLPYKSYIQQ